MKTRSGEILCTACGRESLLKREPRFENFKKVGERLSCLACGHEYPSEDAVPFKQKRGAPAIFSDADRSPRPAVFTEGERADLCLHCVHYVVNPFAQRCELHKRFVQATDTCGRFERKEE